MTAALAARQAREEAFELGMSAAGKLLQRELSVAGNERGKRAAWARYSATGQRVGDAYRAAMAAGLDMPRGVSCLSLRYTFCADMTGANWAYPHATSEQFTSMAAYQAKVIELAAAANVRLDSTFMHRGAL